MFCPIFSLCTPGVAVAELRHPVYEIERFGGRSGGDDVGAHTQGVRWRTKQSHTVSDTQVVGVEFGEGEKPTKHTHVKCVRKIGTRQDQPRVCEWTPWAQRGGNGLTQVPASVLRVAILLDGRPTRNACGYARKGGTEQSATKQRSGGGPPPL